MRTITTTVHAHDHSPQTNMARNNNKFFIIQLLKHDAANKWCAHV